MERIKSAFKPRWRAISRPGASARFEITTAISAFWMRPAAMDSAMATKFDPRPLRRMPIFLRELTLSDFYHSIEDKVGPYSRTSAAVALGRAFTEPSAPGTGAPKV